MVPKILSNSQCLYSWIARITGTPLSTRRSTNGCTKPRRYSVQELSRAIITKMKIAPTTANCQGVGRIFNVTTLTLGPLLCNAPWASPAMWPVIPMSAIKNFTHTACFLTVHALKWSAVLHDTSLKRFHDSNGSLWRKLPENKYCNCPASMSLSQCSVNSFSEVKQFACNWNSYLIC